jgi:hypothetical protein
MVAPIIEWGRRHIGVDAGSPTGAAVIHVDSRGQKQISRHWGQTFD